MFKRIVLRDSESAGWRCYDEPVGTLVAYAPDQVPAVLTEAQRAVDRDGVIAAGFVGYEAAPAFDRSLRTRERGRLPLAAFGLFAGFRPLHGVPGAPGDVGKYDWRLTTDRDEYARSIRTIREQIALGNCYQVNYTIRKRSPRIEDPWALFLRIAHNARYGAYLEFDDFAIVSASPELFFELEGSHIRCRPMKGTARRGMTTASDEAIAAALHGSEKNRAENVMIVDMIRNDLGRIAVPGTVRTHALFELEKYPTVWQMTSTVEARTRTAVDEIFPALFPCASVTGAPKTAAMALIARLEQTPREAYSGAIGWISPGRRAQFSVAIRTAVVDRLDATATYGVGGGIVWDSDADDEYQECEVKARVLELPDDPGGDFELLETLRWTPGDGFFLRDFHLDRLLDSARYFDFELDRRTVESVLDAGAARFGASMRVRLRVNRGGACSLDAEPLDESGPRVWCLRLAKYPVDDRNPFLYHKTTRRRVYAAAVADTGPCDDVLLWNTAGCITETTRANVIVRLQGRDYTPPVSSGLLAGTFRRWLLEHTELEEREIPAGELTRAESIVLVNSVRGRVAGRIDPADRAAGR